MTAAMPNRLRRGAPSLTVMIVATSVVFAVLVSASLLTERDSRSTTTAPRVTDTRSLLAYADAIYPGAEMAGRSIVKGIRPDIADFEAGRISVDVWNADMQTRQFELAAARAIFDAADAPASVGDAAQWFTRAFDDYQRAVELLLRAGSATGAQRTELIDQAASIGDAGDGAFDRGTARIQAARRARGLGPDTRFSDKADG